MKTTLSRLCVGLMLAGASLGAFAQDHTAAATPAEPPKPKGIWISDQENHRVLYVEDLKGTNHKEFGDPGHGPGRLLNPSQVWVDYKGRLYIADTGNDRIVRIDEMTGRGYIEMGGFDGPEGVASNGNELFISDTGHNKVLVYSDMKGELLRTYDDPRLKHPTALWLDEAGDLYVACGEVGMGGRIVKISEPTDKSGTRYKVFEGAGLKSTSFAPSQIVTNKGQCWIVDPSSNHVIRSDSFDGKALRELDGKLFNPQGIAVDADGSIYVADTGNDRLIKIDPANPSEWAIWNGSFADKNSVSLRRPVSIFVYSPVPPPPPPEDEEDPKTGKKKKKKK